MYFVKTPVILQRTFKDILWRIEDSESIYLSFDDGPHPESTPQLLSVLERFQIKASFFCVGRNVLDFPQLYKDIIDAGHTVGIHGHHHLSGWSSQADAYIRDIEKCSKAIPSNLFRPPYGQLSWSQYHQLKTKYKLVLWDVMPGDFDKRIDAEKLYARISNNAAEGSIIVLHDRPACIEKLNVLIPRLADKFNSFAAL